MTRNALDALLLYNIALHAKNRLSLDYNAFNARQDSNWAQINSRVWLYANQQYPTAFHVPIANAKHVQRGTTSMNLGYASLVKISLLIATPAQ